jgi:hypothetical protein
MIRKTWSGIFKRTRALGEQNSSNADQDNQAEVPVENQDVQPTPPNSDVTYPEYVWEFFCWQTHIFIKQIVKQFLLVLTLMTFGLLIVLIGLTSYPFQPQRVPLFYLTLFIGTGVLLAVSVLVAVEKDPIYSRIMGTNPGELGINRSLVGRLVVFAAIPIMGILATQFPEIAEIGIQLITPFIKVLG